MDVAYKRARGKEITKGHGDDDVSRSSHPYGYYSPLERCGGIGLPKRHKGSPYSPRAFPINGYILSFFGVVYDSLVFLLNRLG
jgi:hypothetical protein